jgi:hypothetical protein
MNSEFKTAIHKGMRGTWEAVTYIPMHGKREIEIKTHKTDGGIVTTARVMTHENGMLVHAYGLISAGIGTSGQGDYRERMIVANCRCTEKSVREQHADAIMHAQGVVERALAHYAGEVAIAA